VEYAYPLRVTEYSLRKNSGGAGKFRGGDGIVREVELLADSESRSWLTVAVAGHTDCAAVLTALLDEQKSSTVTARAKHCRQDRVRLKKGDRVRNRVTGGGGLGSQS